MQPQFIHHVSLSVTDVDAAVAFYTDRLGMTVRDDRPEMGSAGAWLDIGPSQLHLIQGEAPGQVGQHFAVAVPDLDDAVAELRAVGVEVRGPAPTGVNGAPQAFVSDPSTNWIEIRQA